MLLWCLKMKNKKNKPESWLPKEFRGAGAWNMFSSMKLAHYRPDERLVLWENKIINDDQLATGERISDEMYDRAIMYVAKYITKAQLKSGKGVRKTLYKDVKKLLMEKKQ